MTPAHLFTPFQVGELRLANRIVIAPMCQYSAEDGRMTDWHLIHLGQLALSGAALLTIEATAVSPEGRITYGDVGLWSDDTEAAMGRVLASIRRYSDMPLAIQLAHAGRKASTEVPWKGGAQIAPGAPNGWRAVAPSPLPFLPSDAPPAALGPSDLARLRDAFAAAARRAGRLDIAAVQSTPRMAICCINSCRRCRMFATMNTAVRWKTACDSHWKSSTRSAPTSPPTARSEFAFPERIGSRAAGTSRRPSPSPRRSRRGAAPRSMSPAADSPADQRIPVGPSYQVPLARAVKAATAMPVVAVGMINDFDQAEAIVATGDADLIALARGMLYDPRWPWRGRGHFGARVKAPEPIFEVAAAAISQSFRCVRNSRIVQGTRKPRRPEAPTLQTLGKGIRALQRHGPPGPRQ